MTALFILHHPAALRPALQRAAADTAFLLLEDAVTLALRTHPDVLLLRARPVALLQRDIELRGFDPAMLSPDHHIIDMAGFVALTVAHLPIVTWF